MGGHGRPWLARILAQMCECPAAGERLSNSGPPRAGMHEDVCTMLLSAAPKKIVYVSCNPATQARDLKILSEKYSIAAVQPVDMFPHTVHVENVALLKLT